MSRPRTWGETKKCSGECGLVKPLGEFYVYVTPERTRVSSRCKKCHVAYTYAKRIEKYGTGGGYNRWQRYGVSPERVVEMIAEQGGLCAICKRKGRKPEHLDHNHETGEVRGMLCRYCNTSLRLVEDHLEDVLAYLGIVLT